MRHYDVAIIGSGPAGQKGAIQAAKLGKRVVVVERGNVVLALRSEATGVAPDQWRTLPSFTMTPIRNGTATFRELKLGDWLYRVQSQGLAPVEGGVFVGGAIASALSVEFYPVRISRRSRDKSSSRRGATKVVGEMPKELKGQRVLVVDDVASSGDTLELARALLEKVGAKAIATACLVSKEEGYQPDYYALSTDQLVVFPWDYDLVEDDRFGPRRR